MAVDISDRKWRHSFVIKMIEPSQAMVDSLGQLEYESARFFPDFWGFFGPNDSQQR